MVRANSQEIVQERLRNGGHNLFVQEGWMMSMGNKKVVKLFCRPLNVGLGFFVPRAGVGYRSDCHNLPIMLCRKRHGFRVEIILCTEFAYRFSLSNR